MRVHWEVWYKQEEATYDTNSGIWSAVLKRPDQSSIFLSVSEGLQPGTLKPAWGAVWKNKQTEFKSTIPHLVRKTGDAEKFSFTSPSHKRHHPSSCVSLPFGTKENFHTLATSTTSEQGCTKSTGNQCGDVSSLWLVLGNATPSNIFPFQSYCWSSPDFISYFCGSIWFWFVVLGMYITKMENMKVCDPKLYRVLELEVEALLWSPEVYCTSLCGSMFQWPVCTSDLLRHLF